MRKGFSLIEVLIVVMTLPLLMLVGDRLFRGLSVDIPRSVQVATQHEVLLKLVETLQEDVARANQVKIVTHDEDPNQTILEIDRGGTPIRYVPINDIVRRTVVYNADDPNRDIETDWTLPHLGVDWTLHQTAGGIDTLQMNTHIVHRVSKRPQLANTHLFYIGLYPALGVHYETN
jgi:prepilin-type N-terminal cleavage/methylation domain-containing protein